MCTITHFSDFQSNENKQKKTKTNDYYSQKVGDITVQLVFMRVFFFTAEGQSHNINLHKVIIRCQHIAVGEEEVPAL